MGVEDLSVVFAQLLLDLDADGTEILRHSRNGLLEPGNFTIYATRIDLTIVDPEISRIVDIDRPDRDTR
jgi:hypothetical protein